MLNLVMKLQVWLSILLILSASIVSYFGFMIPFMGIVFLVFSVFKLIDLKGFINLFVSYDIIAGHSKTYAFFYPFLELLIAICFMFNFFVVPAAFVSFFIMTLGSFSIANILSKKMCCACLGSKIKTPLTMFTLTENITMAVLSLLLIL